MPNLGHFIAEQARHWRAAGIADSEIAIRLGVSRQDLHRVLGSRRSQNAPYPVQYRPPRPALPDLGPLPDPDQFSATLRQWIEKHDLLADEAARLLGTSEKNIFRWRNSGNCGFPLTFLRLMQFLDKYILDK